MWVKDDRNQCDCHPEKMELASADTMALQTARLPAKTSKELPQGSSDTFHSPSKRATGEQWASRFYRGISQQLYGLSDV